jgi:hypothetical protein
MLVSGQAADVAAVKLDPGTSGRLPGCQMRRTLTVILASDVAGYRSKMLAVRDRKFSRWRAQRLIFAGAAPHEGTFF